MYKLIINRIMAKKVLRKFSSTTTLYEDYSMDIAPMADTGESSQTEVVSAGGGRACEHGRP